MGRMCPMPRLQLDWNRKDRHRAATWGELFLDLAIVAINIKLSDHLKAYLDAAGVLRFIAMFCVVFETWSALAFYTTRFYEERSALHQGVYLAVLASFVFMAIPIGDYGADDGAGSSVDASHAVSGAAQFRRRGAAAAAADGGFSQGLEQLTLWFSAAACAGACALAAANWLLAALIPRARILCLVYGLSYTVAGALLGAAAATGPAAAPWLWLAGAAVMKAGPNLASFMPLRWSLPIHVEHVAERFGLFLMLVLGEGVISLVLPPLSSKAAHAAFVTAALLLLWLMRMAYFSGQPFQARFHAMRRKRSAGRLFVQAHLPLSLAALTAGVALKSELTHVGGTLTASESWLLAAGVSAFLLSTSIIRLSHRGLSREIGVGKFAKQAAIPSPSAAPAQTSSDLATVVQSAGDAPTSTAASATAAATRSASAGAEMPAEHHQESEAPSGPCLERVTGAGGPGPAAADQEAPRAEAVPGGTAATRAGEAVTPKNVDIAVTGASRSDAESVDKPTEGQAQAGSDSGSESDGHDSVPPHLAEEQGPRDGGTTVSGGPAPDDTTVPPRALPRLSHRAGWSRLRLASGARAGADAAGPRRESVSSVSSHQAPADSEGVVGGGALFDQPQGTTLGVVNSSRYQPTQVCSV
ncbi:hypothetical protein FNF29_03581 [Cafeteria roenbergensis]|uniref:Uncharacterized protein n=1 Tax=Cafeteria roenbergensis TaxID=33653 RepID=A0A5A8CI07_CAFRO|nr:hypothetical protein FNF29_03581 [Cafeteria roenbergensis]|eukprot:KAA0152692.1 hypothetical protein FNF29_03581 [Cafeteria roenbergensis]